MFSLLSQVFTTRQYKHTDTHTSDFIRQLANVNYLKVLGTLKQLTRTHKSIRRHAVVWWWSATAQPGPVDNDNLTLSLWPALRRQRLTATRRRRRCLTPPSTCRGNRGLGYFHEALTGQRLTVRRAQVCQSVRCVSE